MYAQISKLTQLFLKENIQRQMHIKEIPSKYIQMIMKGLWILIDVQSRNT